MTNSNFSSLLETSNPQQNVLMAKKLYFAYYVPIKLQHFKGEMSHLYIFCSKKFSSKWEQPQKVSQLWDFALKAIFFSESFVHKAAFRLLPILLMCQTVLELWWSHSSSMHSNFFFKQPIIHADGEVQCKAGGCGHRCVCQTLPGTEPHLLKWYKPY